MAPALLDYAGSKEKEHARLTRQLFLRSCWAMLAVCAVIFVIGCFPTKSQVPEERLFATVKGDSVLRHVVVLNRHGARSAITWHDFEGKWAFYVAPGKLTVHGMYQAFQLGQALRQRYGAFVTAAADGGLRRVPRERVSVVSTDFDRTVDTANSLLLGLFSRVGTHAMEMDCECRPNHGERSPPECVAECLGLDDSPAVPTVVVRKTADDPAIQQADICAGWGAWLAELEHSDSWKAQVAVHFPTAAATARELVGEEGVTQLSWPDGGPLRCDNITAPDFNVINFIEGMWSNTLCYDAEGEAYWSGRSNDELVALLQPVAKYAWQTRYTAAHGPQTGGMLLHELLSLFNGTAQRLIAPAHAGEGRRRARHLLDGADGSETSAVNVYSAHDTTVFSLLAALGAASSAHLPLFTAHVTLELWQTHPQQPLGPEDFTVRVMYDGENVAETLGCQGGVCTFDSLIQGTKDAAVDPSTCVPWTRPPAPPSSC